MELNIYEKKKVVKTFSAETYDLMFGTVEDVAEAIDLDSLQSGSDVEIIKLVGKLVMSSMDTVKELLKDIALDFQKHREIQVVVCKKRVSHQHISQSQEPLCCILTHLCVI